MTGWVIPYLWIALEMLLPILSLSNLALLTPRCFHYPNFLVERTRSYCPWQISVFHTRLTGFFLGSLRNNFFYGPFEIMKIKVFWWAQILRGVTKSWNQANSENFSCHLEPRNLPRSPKPWAKNLVLLSWTVTF